MVLDTEKIYIDAVIVEKKKAITANGRGYEIVAEYEARTYRTAQSYIRATTFQVCSTTAMFYSLC